LEAFKSIGQSVMTTDPNEQVICVLFAESTWTKAKNTVDNLQLFGWMLRSLLVM